jgi:hypothetical protein
MDEDTIIRWMDYVWHGAILVAIAALLYAYFYSTWSAIVDHGPQPVRRRLRRLLRPPRDTPPRRRRRQGSSLPPRGRRGPSSNP